MSVIRAEHIVKRYPGTVALDDVSVEFTSGKIHAFVAKNGSGKSTLLKIFAGAEHKTEGKIYLNDQEVNFSDPVAACEVGIATVFQELSLVPSMGFDMESHLIEELMPMIQNWFPASDKREDNFIAGLSMGGMGTGHYTAWYPEKFGGAAMLSGCPSNLHGKENFIDPNSPLGKAVRAGVREMNQINSVGGPEKLLTSKRNDWDRFGELAHSGKLPKLYAACGTNDFLYEGNYQAFKRYAQEIGLEITFEEIEGYTHEWRFWDLAIQKAMDFFGIVNEDRGNAF